jgi:hypothetical protein
MYSFSVLVLVLFHIEDILHNNSGGAKLTAGSVFVERAEMPALPCLTLMSSIVSSTYVPLSLFTQPFPQQII